VALHNDHALQAFGTGGVGINDAAAVRIARRRIDGHARSIGDHSERGGEREGLRTPARPSLAARTEIDFVFDI
jgi:hypothetical protein